MSKELSVYTIPPTVKFLDILAKGIIKRYGETDFLSDVRILLPTRRAARNLQDAFLNLSSGKPLILPQLSSLGDVDADEIGFMDAGMAERFHEIPPAISPLQRQILLSKLVKGVSPFVMSESHAYMMAGPLARLIDQVHTEDTSFDKLEGLIDDPELSNQWGISLKFLNILKDMWPAILEQRGVIDPADRRKRLMKAQIELWQKSPPQTPVIAAGSTGSIPVTSELLKVVAGLPQGEIILPGLDLTLDNEAWDEIKEGHPQYTLKNLILSLNIPRVRVQNWPECRDETECETAARDILWREVMRPAETTGAWTSGEIEIPANATEGLSLLEAESSEEEAHTIALILRHALERDKSVTAALVTPDRVLAERVQSSLRRWNIEIDDSAGRPLTSTPRGRFILTVLQLAFENMSPVALLALLEDNLSGFGYERRRFEGVMKQITSSNILRGSWTDTSFTALLEDEELDISVKEFLSHLHQKVIPLKALMQQETVPFKRLVEEHLKLCEFIAGSDTEEGASLLWRSEDGEEAARLFRGVLEDSGSLARDAAHTDFESAHTYKVFLESIMAATPVRPAYGTHPRLAILGQLEARLIQADILVLGSLNEETWPPLVTNDPWMSRHMRMNMSLPTPERAITLSAHDFVQGASARDVYMTRSKKNGGVPTVPARWLQRLNTIVTSHGLSDPKEKGQGYLEYARRFNRADEDTLPPLKPPNPVPPLSVRPTTFSATSLELLMRDPYALYAKKILKLKPLDPLEEEKGPKEKGQVLHDIFHKFLLETGDQSALGNDALDTLLQIGRNELALHIEDPSLWVSWWPRFENLAISFVDEERKWRDEGYSFVAGETEGSAMRGRFTLTARADRIDRDRNGKYAVIDYKTSSTTISPKDVQAGFSPQLTVAGIILHPEAEGGFPKLKDQESSYLGYWHLTGGQKNPLVKKSVDTGKGVSVENIIEDGLQGVLKVLENYDDPERGYPSLPFAGYEPRYQEYEHLARVLEWRSADDSEAAA